MTAPEPILDARADLDASRARSFLVATYGAIGLSLMFGAFFALRGLPGPTATHVLPVIGAGGAFAARRSGYGTTTSTRLFMALSFLYFLALSSLLGGFFPILMCWLLVFPVGAAMFEDDPRARAWWAAGMALGAAASYVTHGLGWFDRYDVPSWQLGPLYYPLSVASLYAYFIMLLELLLRQRDRALSKEIELTRRLVHAERAAALGTLSAGLAHEINNPAAVLTTTLDVLQRELVGRGSADAEAAIGDAQHALQRIRSVTNRLASAVEPGQGREAEARCDLRAAIEDAVRLTDNELRHVAIVTVDAPTAAPIPGYHAALVQVFANLLLNACHALQSTGRPTDANQITVSLARVGEEAVATVADNGPGISAVLRERVFDPFYTTKPVGLGSGLGLAVCRQTLAGLGGRITVDDTPGGGATFTVRVPLRLAQEGAPSAVSSGSRTADAGPLRVLVVDDDFAVRRSLVRVLRRHDVTAVEGGAAALEVLARASFNVIVCDVMMPDVSGEAVFTRCPPEARARFVFVTGGILDDDLRRRIAATGRPVLQKPFDAAALEAVLGLTARG